MKIIFSRKGFDSSSGGCPSPIFPDGSLVSLPIPDKSSPVRYRDLDWNGRNLGDLVEELTRGRQRRDYCAHLDPDLQAKFLDRDESWRPVLGQHGAAQGHLRNHRIGCGDLFVFWGVFRRVDEALKWQGPPMHLVWGWLQVGEVLPVDASVRTGLGSRWKWLARHPHMEFAPDPSNTLYVASDRLEAPGVELPPLPGAGVLPTFCESRRLSPPEAAKPSAWSLPAWFLPEGRPALSYHADTSRWSAVDGRTHLKVVSRGQEFVLDADHYPEAMPWLVELLRGEGSRRSG